jgi:YVTN family beta-propeller protein
MPSDFDAPVGGAVEHYAFTVACSGAEGAEVAVASDNPQFELTWGASYIQCGSTYLFHARFSPRAPGLTTANVTISSTVGAAAVELVGNGILSQAPAQWVADLGPGTSASRLVHDAHRNLLYVTDSALNRVLVFSPATRTVVATIPVGLQPVGLALTPDGETLYVANSGEYAISVIDINLRQQLYKIATPSLGPGSGYTPNDITVISGTVALVSSAPPGAASGGPIYQLDLGSHAISARSDLGGGRYSLLRTSLDWAATVILHEPGASPTGITWYQPATGSIQTAGHGLERSLGIAPDASRVVTSFHDCNVLSPDLTVLNEALNVLGRIQLLGCQAVGVAFNAVVPALAYATDGRNTHALAVADTLGLRQTHELALHIPQDYYMSSHALVTAADGVWTYQLLGQVYNAPPSKLIAVNVQPADLSRPVSAMAELAPTQSHNWWLVSWAGSDTGSGIDRYDVQFKVGAQGAWRNWLSTNMTQALFTNGVPGETYYYRVRAVDTLGNSEAYRAGFDAMTLAGSDVSGLSRNFLPNIGR